MTTTRHQGGTGKILGGNERLLSDNDMGDSLSACLERGSSSRPSRLCVSLCSRSAQLEPPERKTTLASRQWPVRPREVPLAAQAHHEIGREVLRWPACSSQLPFSAYRLSPWRRARPAPRRPLRAAACSRYTPRQRVPPSRSGFSQATGDLRGSSFQPGLATERALAGPRRRLRDPAVLDECP